MEWRETIKYSKFFVNIFVFNRKGNKTEIKYSNDYWSFSCELEGRHMLGKIAKM